MDQSEEAKKCIHVATSAMSTGDYDKASRFLDKASRMGAKT